MPRYSHLYRLLVLLLFPLSALAQPQGPEAPRPRLDFIFPCGGKVGTRVESQIFGADLDDVKELRFTHPGIKAERIEAPEPKPDPKQTNNKKMAKPAREGGKFKIQIDANVKPGMYEVRVVNGFGISNPRVFMVGDLNEVAEQEPNNDVPQAQKIELNTTVNGSFANPTDVDYFQFQGKKGQRVLASCRTGTIDSRSRPLVEIYSLNGRLLNGNRNYSGNDALADAVLPADGDYLVRVCEFAYTFIPNTPQNAYFYRLSVTTNPWIDAVFPPMVLPGKSTPVTIYGRNLPQGKKKSAFTLDGREIEEMVVSIPAPSEAEKLGTGIRIDSRSAELDGFTYSLAGPQGVSNTVPIFFAGDPVILEKEPNDTPETAQEIPVGCEVAGRLDKRGDRDWYSFTAKKGQTIWIDLWSDRLDCTTNGVSSFMYITLKKGDPNAGNLAELEDSNDTLSQNHFFTRNGDPPSYKFTVPEDGKYLIQVGSREANTHFGLHAAYRLCVSAGHPDFRVVAIAPYTMNALPTGFVLNRDGPSFVEVYVFRRHGFKEPISLTAEGLPNGVECPPQIIGTNQVYGALVFNTKPDALEFTGTIRIAATARYNGKDLKRDVRTATVTWAGQQNNANFPLLARLDQECAIAVREKGAFRIRIDTDKITNGKEKVAQPIVVKPGDKLTVPFEIARSGPETKVAVTAAFVNSQRNNAAMQGNQPPLLMNNGQPLLNVPADKNEGSFVIDVRNNSTPGLYPVILRAYAQVPFDKNPDGKNKKPTTFFAVSQPFTVQVLPASVGRLSVDVPGAAKQGKDFALVAKIARENDYDGEYRLKLILPMNVKGIEAKEVVLPAGQSEVKFPLTVAKDANPTNYQNLVLEALARYENKHEIKSEAKFNLQVVKDK